MRNKLGNLLWGATLIVVGTLLACNHLGILNVTLFFDGWWTLFIIVPCIIGMIQTGVHTGNVIGLSIGVLLLLGAQDILSFATAAKLVFPVILVCVGVGVLLGSTFPKFRHRSIHINCEGSMDYMAIFSKQNYSCVDEVFTGCDMASIFGGIELDLRSAKIEKDIVIEAVSVFGASEIILPPNVKVKISSVPIFGNVSNNARTPSGEAEATIYIEGVCVFGNLIIR